VGKEILKPTIKVNDNHEIENYAYRAWMNEKSDIAKAIYHLSKAANYLLLYGDIEEETDIFNENAQNLEWFCNQASSLQSEITKYVDENPNILQLEKEILEKFPDNNRWQVFKD
jgi:hypothetical protein